MKLKQLMKILLIISFSIFSIACNDSNKEENLRNKYKTALIKPKSDKTRELGLISLWRKSDNDPLSATKIGYAYSEELKDYDKAIEWYKYSNSMKPLGINSNYMCYAYQMKKEYEEAIKWCKNAIELGNDEALFQLAYTYEEKKDYKKAEKWFLKSFEKKDKNAPMGLGYLYTNHLKDYKKAEKYYKEGVKIKDLEAFHNLSRLYHHNLKNDLKASAYAITLIGNKYTERSVLKLLRKWKIPNETIKEGYELQLNSDEFTVKFEGKLNLK